MGPVEELAIFLTGLIGAFVWVILSYRIIPGFKMENSLFGEKFFISIWCLLGGFLAWLLGNAEGYGLHPAMVCALFTGFGWSGIFTGISGTLIRKRDATEADRLIDDVMT